MHLSTASDWFDIKVEIRTTLFIVCLLAALASDATAQRMGNYRHGSTHPVLLLQLRVDNHRSYFRPTELLRMSRKVIQETDARKGVTHRYEGVELQNLASNNDVRKADSIQISLDNGKKQRLSKTELDSVTLLLVADTVDGKRLTGYAPYTLVLKTKTDSAQTFQGVHCIAITYAQSQEEDRPEANPGRPTVSTPATLTPLGYLQFESGLTAARNSPEFSSRYSFTEVLKLSVIPCLELVASAEPIVNFTTDRVPGNRVGDIFFGAQGVLLQGERSKPTLAASYFHRAYNGGAPEFDYGSPTNSFLLLASANVKGLHYDANAFFTELEQNVIRRGQFGQSLTISHPFLKNFTLSGEVWHFTQPFLRSNAVGNLWAISYTARKTMVFDVGFNHGLTHTSTQWEIFAGFTYLLPHRLWNGRAFQQGTGGPH